LSEPKGRGAGRLGKGRDVEAGIPEECATEPLDRVGFKWISSRVVSSRPPFALLSSQTVSL
jgi:hypothetical protein